MDTLKQLTQKLMEALEDPAHGFVFDDFDQRYTQKRERVEQIEAERFWSNKVSFAFDSDDSDDEKGDWLEDGGEGVERMLEAIEPENWRARLHAARNRVCRQCPETLATFNAIIRNGKNKKESIWQLMTQAKAKPARRGWRHGRSTTETWRDSRGCLALVKDRV